MAYEDLQDSSKPWPDDNNYFKVTVLDLDVNTLYPLQFRWQYEDQSYGIWSSTKEITTPNIVVPEVSNVVTSWKGTTLTIAFDRPEQLVNGSMVNRAKDFIINLTYNSKTKTITVPVDTTKTSQTYTLTEEEARQFWRDANDAKFFPTAYTGLIKTVTVDQYTSTGVSFNTTAYSDSITNQAISDASWALVAALDGYNVTFSEFTNVSDVELYYETEVWESTSSGGTYTKVAARSRTPISRPYYGDTSTKYVKIRHATKKGTFSQYSNVKTIASITPTAFDSTAPTNNITLSTTTTTTDPDGIFQFGYQTIFNWTLPADINTNPIYDDQRGYKIRFRIKNSGAPYTFMSVLGKTATSTKLNGLLAGATYEVGITTYDVYDNIDTANWKTYPDIVIPTNASFAANAKLTAGPMEFGYGVGSGATQKGIYLAPQNYWYITGNTQNSNFAEFKVGGTNDYMFWDGSKLAITGSLESSNARIKGSLDIGSPSDTIDGQLRVSLSNGATEIGKFDSATTTWLQTQTGQAGIQYGMVMRNTSTNKYILLNSSDASIRANNVKLTGEIVATSFQSLNGSTNGITIEAGSFSDQINFYRSSGLKARFLGNDGGFIFYGPADQYYNMVNGGGTVISNGTGTAQILISSAAVVQINTDTNASSRGIRNIESSNTAPDTSTGAASAAGYKVGDIYLVRE
jgi:hypothetical protein